MGTGWASGERTDVGGLGSAASLGPAEGGFGTGNVTAVWLLWAEPLLMFRLSVLKGWLMAERTP